MNTSASLMWEEEVRVVDKMQEADNGNENYFAPFTLMKGMYCFYRKEERDVLLT